jgi:hypothetical protein
MITALGLPGAYMTTLVELDLPAATLRLYHGSGAALTDSSSRTFVSKDATYGALGGVSGINDGMDDQAPVVTVTLFNPTTTAQANVSDPAAQGQAATIWAAVVVPSTGLLVADPSPRFVGVIDFATWKVGPSARSVDVSLITYSDYFFPQDDWARLNDPSHQHFWSGETGLEFIAQVQQQIPWGSDAPRPVLVTDVPPIGGTNIGANGGLSFIPPWLGSTPL